MTANVRPLLIAWQREVLDELDTLLPGLLDDAVTTLISLADKAPSNQLQGAFFHAQQELRREKEQLVASYLSELQRLMAQPLDHGKDPHAGKDDLGLVNLEAFERSVARQRFTDRAVQEYYGILHQLRLRLSVVNGGTPVDDEAIPAGPVQLLRALDEVLRPFMLDRLAVRQVFELFDKHILRDFAGEQYETLNARLIKAGILPNLRLEVRHQPARGAARQATSKPAAKATGATDGPAEATDMPRGGDLAQLLQTIRELLPSATPGLSSDPRQAMPADQVAQLIDSQAGHLGEMLPEHGIFAADGQPLPLQPEQLAESLRAIARQRNEIKRLVGHDKLSVFDESTLDIVGALFEMMLNDARLAPHIKALLSHLHTPYLKLALRERDMLENPDHPARRLLDELVDAGEAWGGADKLGSSIYPVFQEIVDTLRNTEVPGHALIEQQRDYLAQCIETLAKQQQLRTSRTTDSEIGRARLDLAKQMAEAAIIRQLGDAPVCQACVDFLTGPWHDYLTLLLLKHNCQAEGQEWQQAEQLAGRIINIARAITSAVPPPAGELDALHDALAAQIGRFIPHYMADVQKLLRAMQQMLDQDRDSIHRIPQARITPRHQSAKLHPGEDLELSSAELKTAEHLRKIRAGTRFRIPHSDGNGSRLVTLTWFNPQTDRMLFVDQNGTKAALLPVHQLARCLHTQKAQLVRQEQQQPFFTRALSALKNYLEKRLQSRQEIAHA
jgi:hypothetical protein